MNDIVSFVFSSAFERFCSSICVSTFEFDAICICALASDYDISDITSTIRGYFFLSSCVVCPSNDFVSQNFYTRNPTRARSIIISMMALWFLILALILSDQVRISTFLQLISSISTRFSDLMNLQFDFVHDRHVMTAFVILRLKFALNRSGKAAFWTLVCSKPL